MMDDDSQDQGVTEPEGAPRERSSSPAEARARLRAAMRPRPSRNQAVIGGLCLLLGFAMVVQVRAHGGAERFETARVDELVTVLDSLSQRSERLRDEVSELRETKRQVESGYQERRALVDSARDRADTLGMLAGTLPATGPGIELTIADPGGKVDASTLLDALQELRDAGAEVIQIGEVRVVTSTYITNPADGEGVVVDGHTLRPPYSILSIGSPSTMSAALGIPGGVLEGLHGIGAGGHVTEKEDIDVTALRDPAEAQYARPAPGDRGGSSGG